MAGQQDGGSTIQHVEVRKGKFVFRYSVRKSVNQKTIKPNSVNTTNASTAGSTSKLRTQNGRTEKFDKLPQNCEKSKTVKQGLIKYRHDPTAVRKRRNKEKNRTACHEQGLSNTKKPYCRLKCSTVEIPQGSLYKDKIKAETGENNICCENVLRIPKNHDDMHTKDAERSKTNKERNSGREGPKSTVTLLSNKAVELIEVKHDVSGTSGIKGEDVIGYLQEITIATMKEEESNDCYLDNGSNSVKNEDGSDILCSCTENMNPRSTQGHSRVKGNSTDVKRSELSNHLTIEEKTAVQGNYLNQMEYEPVANDNTIFGNSAEVDMEKDRESEDYFDNPDKDIFDRVRRTDNENKDSTKIDEQKDDKEEYEKGIDACITIDDREDDNVDKGDEHDDDDKTVIYNYDDDDDLLDETVTMDVIDKEILNDNSIPATSNKLDRSHRLHILKRKWRDSHFTEKLKTVKIKTKVGNVKPKSSNEVLEKCSLCNRMYQKSYIQLHISQVHHGIRPFKCHLCDWSFAIQSHLNRHLKSHAKNPYFPYKRNQHTPHNRGKSSKDGVCRKFTCDICFKGYTELRYLKRHMAKHTGLRIYKCEICGKSYRYRHGLARHMQLHKDGLKISCGICNQKFYDSYGLKKHLRDHMDSQNAFEYKCGLCNIYYRTLACLKRHMDAKHPNSKPQGVFKRNNPTLLLPSDSISFEKTQSQLVMSEVENIPSESYECRTCGRFFDKKSKLLTHLSRSHGAKKKRLKRSDIDINAYVSGTLDLEMLL